MAKYELSATDAKQLLRDIHTIATSLKTLSELTKKGAAKEEERSTGSISDLIDSFVSPHQVPLEPDPDERG